MKIFFDFLVFAIIIGIILYFAMFYEKDTNIYACSEVTKEDPIEVQKKCKLR
jgi:hypothetical protein